MPSEARGQSVPVGSRYDAFYDPSIPKYARFTRRPMRFQADVSAPPSEGKNRAAGDGTAGTCNSDQNSTFTPTTSKSDASVYNRPEGSGAAKPVSSTDPQTEQAQPVPQKEPVSSTVPHTEQAQPVPQKEPANSTDHQTTEQQVSANCAEILTTEPKSNNRTDQTMMPVCKVCNATETAVHKSAVTSNSEHAAEERSQRQGRMFQNREKPPRPASSSTLGSAPTSFAGPSLPSLDLVTEGAAQLAQSSQQFASASPAGSEAFVSEVDPPTGPPLSLEAPMAYAGVTGIAKAVSCGCSSILDGTKREDCLHNLFSTLKKEDQENGDFSLTLMVRNLWGKCTPALLVKGLESIGLIDAIKEVYIPMRSSKKSGAWTNRGFGFITVRRPEDRASLVERIHHQPIQFYHGHPRVLCLVVARTRQPDSEKRIARNLYKAHDPEIVKPRASSTASQNAVVEDKTDKSNKPKGPSGDNNNNNSKNLQSVAVDKKNDNKNSKPDSAAGGKDSERKAPGPAAEETKKTTKNKNKHRKKKQRATQPWEATLQQTDQQQQQQQQLQLQLQQQLHQEQRGAQEQNQPQLQLPQQQQQQQPQQQHHHAATNRNFQHQQRAGKRTAPKRVHL